MKRVAVAVLILVLVGVACAASLVYQSYGLKRLDGLAVELLTVYDSGDMEQCFTLSERFADECDRSAGVLLFFVRHADVAPLVDEAAMMPELLQRGEEELFLASLLRCRGIIGKLDHQELPRADNVF